MALCNGILFVFLKNNHVLIKQDSSKVLSQFEYFYLTKTSTHHPTSPSKLLTNLETGKAFVSLLDVNKNYAGASELLADKFRFISPRFNAASKHEWLANFPNFHKNTPVFEDFIVEKNGNVLTRKASKKMGFISFSLLESTEFNEEGKIQTITAKIARKTAPHLYL